MTTSRLLFIEFSNQFTSPADSIPALLSELLKRAIEMHIPKLYRINKALCITMLPFQVNEDYLD